MFPYVLEDNFQVGTMCVVEDVSEKFIVIGTEVQLYLGSSPDLNFTYENVWHYTKGQVKIGQEITNVLQLKDKMFKMCA